MALLKKTPKGVWILRLGSKVSLRWDRPQRLVYLNFGNQRFELRKV